MLGRIDEARRSLETALAIFLEHDDRTGIADAQHGLGAIHREQGRLDAAAASYRHADGAAGVPADVAVVGRGVVGRTNSDGVGARFDRDGDRDPGAGDMGYRRWRDPGVRRTGDAVAAGDEPARRIADRKLLSDTADRPPRRRPPSSEHPEAE